MKKIVFKRAAALLLSAALAIAVSACATYADTVKGFADAVAYMSGETNVRSEMTLSAKLSDVAQPVSFSAFLSQCLSVTDESQFTRLAADYEIGLALDAESYDGTARVSIGWLGVNGVKENLMTLILIDDTMYISTELLSHIGGIAALAEYGAILSMIDCDYLKIDVSEMTKMLDETAGMGLEPDPDAQASLQAAADKLVSAVSEYTPKVLTNYENVLKREGGGYTLTLDAETSVALLREVLNIMAEYEADIKAFLLETGKDLGMGDELAEISALDIKGAVDELQRELDKIVIGKDLPKFDLVYKVSGEGEGDKKKQASSLLFTMPVPDDMKAVAPFEKLTLKAGGVTTVTTAPVAAPTGKVLTMEELEQQLTGGLMGMYGLNPSGGLAW